MTEKIQAVMIWLWISDYKSWKIWESNMVFLFYFALDEMASLSLVGGYCWGTAAEIQDWVKWDFSEDYSSLTHS